MKRTEIYTKNYEVESSDGRNYLGAGKDKGVIEELNRMCISCTPTKVIFSDSFLFYNGTTIVGIDIKENFSHNPKKNILLHVTPSTAKTPRELSDLLLKAGFKKSG